MTQREHTMWLMLIDALRAISAVTAPPVSEPQRPSPTIQRPRSEPGSNVIAFPGRTARP